MLVLVLAQLLADGLHLLAQVEFPLLLVHVLLERFLQLLAHLRGFHPLVQLLGRGMEQLIQGADLQQLLLLLHLEVELGDDHVSRVEMIGHGVDGDGHLRRQLGQLDQILKLVADIENQGVDLLVLDHLHGHLVDPGPDVGLTLGDLGDLDLFQAADQDLVVALVHLGHLVNVADHADPVQVDYRLACLLRG